MNYATFANQIKNGIPNRNEKKSNNTAIFNVVEKYYKFFAESNTDFSQ